MLRKDIDIDRIECLLNSIPEYMDIQSIDLNNGYSCRIVAGDLQLSKSTYDESLQALNELLNSYKNNCNDNSQKLDAIISRE